MSKALSLELRVRVLAAVADGASPLGSPTPDVMSPGGVQRPFGRLSWSGSGCRGLPATGWALTGLIWRRIWVGGWTRGRRRRRRFWSARQAERRVAGQLGPARAGGARRAASTWANSSCSG